MAGIIAGFLAREIIQQFIIYRTLYFSIVNTGDYAIFLAMNKSLSTMLWKRVASK